MFFISFGLGTGGIHHSRQWGEQGKHWGEGSPTTSQERKASYSMQAEKDKEKHIAIKYFFPYDFALKSSSVSSLCIHPYN